MTDIREAAHIARQMYLDRASLPVIYATTGLTKYELYFWLDGGPWVGAKRLLDAIPRRLMRTRQSDAVERVALVRRMQRVCDQQLTEMEKRENPSATDREQDARRIALITRALDGLTTLDGRNREMTRRKKAAGDNERATNGGEPLPRDIDELRRSVARELRELTSGQDGCSDDQT